MGVDRPTQRRSIGSGVPRRRGPEAPTHTGGASLRREVSPATATGTPNLSGWVKSLVRSPAKRLSWETEPVEGSLGRRILPGDAPRQSARVLPSPQGEMAAAVDRRIDKMASTDGSCRA